MSDTHTASVTASGTNALGGTLSAVVSEAANAADGQVTWTYVVDNTSAAVQALAQGETAIETFTISVSDGHGSTVDQVVTVTVSGTNDAPTIEAVVTQTVADTAAVNVIAPITGSLAGDDVDAGAVLTYGLAVGELGTSAFGALTVNTDGSYSFAVNSAAVNALAAGATTSVSFDVSVTDEHNASATTTISFDLTGANDAAIISGVSSGAVTEDAVINTVIGDLNATDVDGPPDSFTAVGAGAATANGYGTYAVDATGHWTYTLDNSNAAVNALNNASAPLTDSFTVFTTDGPNQVVSITINGHTDVTAVVVPPVFTGGGDPNDFDSLIAGTNGSPTNGPDVLFDGAPFDGSINLGGGNDIYYAGPGNDGTISGSGGNDTIYGQAGNDDINGNNDNDLLFGGSGNDNITGNNGNDTIFGGSGNDIINGDGDNDFITGGYGADIIDVSQGNDTVNFLSLLDTGDIINGFNGNGAAPGGDIFDLSAIDASAVLAGMQTLDFTGTTANDFGVWFETDGTNSKVYVDTNGNTATAELSFTVNNVNVLFANDFDFIP